MRRLKEVLLMVHGRENDVGPRPSPSPASFSSTRAGQDAAGQLLLLACRAAEGQKAERRT